MANHVLNLICSVRSARYAYVHCSFAKYFIFKKTMFVCETVLVLSVEPRGGGGGGGRGWKFWKQFKNFKEKMESSLEAVTGKLPQILLWRPMELIRCLLLQVKQVLIDFRITVKFRIP